MAKKTKLVQMKLRHKCKADPVAAQEQGCVETTFPGNLQHEPTCNKQSTYWYYEIDPDTGNVTLSCDKCSATHVFEIGAVEE
jgi:hypothetical protein